MRTLLLAETHAATRRHLEEQLAQAGYQILAAGTPDALLELFAVSRADAILLAADFPTGDGAPITARIAEHGLRPRIPLVVIDKAHLGKARGRQAILSLKPNVYVEDPLKANALREKLGTLWETAPATPIAGATTVLDAPPTEGGDRPETDLPGKLCRAFRERRSGILVVAHRERASYLFFFQGAPVACMRVGDDSPAASGVWREDVGEQVAEVVGMREGRFAFFSGDAFPADMPRIEIPALAPVLQGARRAYRTQRFGRVLKPHMDDYPVRTPSFAEDLRALGLETADVTLAMQISGRAKLRELIAHGRGGLSRSYSLIWFLHLCGAVRFSPDAIVGGEAAEAMALAPRRRKPMPPERAKQLQEEALRILTGSYFKVLGLDIAADREAVENAYREVATRFHPDTYAEYDIGAIQDALESVQDKLTAAYRVLSVDDKRRAYLQYLLSRTTAARVSPVHVDAELAVRRGEAHFKRGDQRSALRAFAEATTLNPKEPEYASYLAWFTFRNGEGTAEERARAAEKILKRALGLHPRAERPNVIRAIIEAELGEVPAARRRLLQILEQNPNAPLAKAALRRVGR